MRNKLLAVAAAGLLAATTVTACDDSSDSSDASSGSANTATTSGKARVGVILPDTTSSTRWVTADAKYLKEAFAQAGVPAEIQNAQGDRANFVRIGESMINSGVKVLIIANLDSTSGKTVLDAARAKKIWTIDYDRLTLNGGANYYVSFDNEKVGELQAYGLINCLRAKKVNDPLVAELNGSLTDNNATLFKSGYDSVLQPHYDDASFTKGPDQWVPDWNNDEGGKIFTQMVQQQPKINGVLAANDGIAGAVIKVLRSKGLNGQVPVTGQDATLEGLQNLLTGDQCVTIYKQLLPEAQTAAKIAVELYKGQKPVVGDQLKDPESGAYIPFAKLPPKAITVNDINTVLTDKFVTKKDLCKGKYETLCTQYGVK
jgi:D-xylose transport system substrate-binding protein